MANCGQYLDFLLSPFVDLAVFESSLTVNRVKLFSTIFQPKNVLPPRKFQKPTLLVSVGLIYARVVKPVMDIVKVFFFVKC